MFLRLAACLTLVTPELVFADDSPSIPAVDAGFETKTPRGSPFGWYVEGNPKTMQIGVVHSIEPLGHVLAITNMDDDPLALYTLLPRTASCGRELSIDVDAWTTGGAQFAPVLLGSSTGAPTIGQIHTVGPERGRMTLQIDLPSGCATGPLYIGLLAFGASYLDNFAVAIDGDKVRWDELRSPAPTDLEYLRKAASNLVESELSGGLQEVLSRRVVALGEASHGAAATFELKRKVISYLIEKGELGVVALEMPVAAAEIVDDYVSGRTADRKRAIRALVFPAWQTEEFVTLIDGLRAHNQRAEHPVLFAGIDVQQPHLAFQRLDAVWSHGSDTLRGLAEKISSEALPDETIAELDRLRAEVKLTSAELEYVRLIDAGLRLDRPALGGRSRSFHLADEVLRLAGSTNRQIVVWADNTHVTKATGAMGYVLAQNLEGEYGVIGFTFGSGMYSAYGPELHYDAEPAYPGTHEQLFLQAELDDSLIDLTDLPPDHPALQARGFRYVGSMPQRYGEFLPHELTEHFDAVGFSARSSATKYLLDPQF